MPVPWGMGTNYHTMSDTTGPGGRLAPELVDTGGKQRTKSCYIIRERRLTFLHYILNQETNSMIYKFFETQLEKRNKKDWVNTVENDLKEIGLENLNFDYIKTMSKLSFKKIYQRENTK